MNKWKLQQMNLISHIWKNRWFQNASKYSIYNERPSTFHKETKCGYKNRLRFSCSFEHRPKFLQQCSTVFWSQMQTAKIRPNDCWKGYCTSALYVNNLNTSRATHVDVALNLVELYEDVTNLVENINRRQLDVDVGKLKTLYHRYSSLLAKKQEIENMRNEVKNVMKLIVKDKSQTAEAEKISVAEKGKELRLKLKTLLPEFHAVEEELMLASLSLPTQVDPTTLEEDTEVRSFGVKPEFTATPKSHVEIASAMGFLKTCPASPGSFYLSGNLAMLERNLLRKADSIMLAHNMVKVRGPDLVKALVVEGVGKNIHSNTETIELENKEETANLETTYFLTGTGIEVFASDLTRMMVAEKSLPLKLYSVGTAYHAAHIVDGNRKEDLCHAGQSSVLSVFGACSDYEESHKLLHEYQEMIEKLYKWSGVSVRTVQASAKNLHKSESLRIDFEVWMPSYNQYFKCGSVSLNRDFFSRRLMMYSTSHTATTDSSPHQYLYMVSGNCLDAFIMMASVLENCQEKT